MIRRLSILAAALALPAACLAISVGHFQKLQAVAGSRPITANGYSNPLYAWLGTGSNYISTANPVALQVTNNFTMAAWIWPGAGTGPQTIGGYNLGGVVRGYVMQRTAANNVMYLQNGGAWASATDNGLVTQVWNYVVATVEADSKVRIYRNGVLRATSAAAGSAVSFSAATFHVGTVGGAVPASVFIGAIDEFVVDNRAWSSNEILANYNAGAGVYTPAGTNLLTWHLDEGTAEIVNDASGNANTGRLGVTTTWTTGHVLGPNP